MTLIGISDGGAIRKYHSDLDSGERNLARLLSESVSFVI